VRRREPALVEPKSRTSLRTLPLSKPAVEVLRAHRTRWANEKLRLGDRWLNDWDLVFVGPQGEPLHAKNVWREWRRILTAAELPVIRPHDLRHTAGTLLREQGVDIKVIQETLGHSSISTTLDAYGHVTPGLREQAVGAQAVTLAVVSSARHGGASRQTPVGLCLPLDFVAGDALDSTAEQHHHVAKTRNLSQRSRNRKSDQDCSQVPILLRKARPKVLDVDADQLTGRGIELEDDFGPAGQEVRHHAFVLRRTQKHRVGAPVVVNGPTRLPNALELIQGRSDAYQVVTWCGHELCLVDHFWPFTGTCGGWGFFQTTPSLGETPAEI
jgi:hypothetical protein